MNKQDKIKAISEAMEYTGEEPKKGIMANMYIIKETCNEEVKNVLMHLIYDENIGGNQNLSYEITAKACEIIGGLNESAFDNENKVQETCNEVASVYISDRLSYLNNNNHLEIYDELKACDCDIQEACAIWYNSKVQEVCDSLIAFINE